MTVTALHPRPGLRAFMKDQIAVVGAAVRREAALVLIGVVLLLAVLLAAAFRLGNTLSLDPLGDIYAVAMVAAFGALFAPLAVWKGEPRFGSAPLWLLPMDHRTSAIGKVAAGWIWTMAVVATLFVLLVSVALASGGTVGAARTVYLSPTLDPANISPVRWSVQWWQFAALFTGATIGYLTTSALLLATPYPGRWAVGVGLVLFAIFGVIDITNDPGLIGAARNAINAFIAGPYGVDAFLSGGVEAFDELVELPNGRRLVVLTALPSPGRWVGATLLWLSGSLTAVFAAASRHRGR